MSDATALKERQEKRREYNRTAEVKVCVSCGVPANREPVVDELCEWCWKFQESGKRFDAYIEKKSKETTEKIRSNRNDEQS